MTSAPTIQHRYYSSVMKITCITTDDHCVRMVMDQSCQCCGKAHRRCSWLGMKSHTVWQITSGSDSGTQRAQRYVSDILHVQVLPLLRQHSGSYFQWDHARPPSICVYGLPMSCWVTSQVPQAYMYEISSDINSYLGPICSISRASYNSCGTTQQRRGYCCMWGQTDNSAPFFSFLSTTVCVLNFFFAIEYIWW